MFEAPPLEINDIRLRQVGVWDAPAMQTNFGNWNVVKTIGGIPWPYPEDGALTYIERRLEEARTREIYFWGIFLGQDAAELIGAIEYRFYEDEDENRGFWLSEAHWGRGIMTDAVRVTQDFVFLELGKPRLLVRSLRTNAASKAIKEKTGASLIGRSLGLYHDGEREEDVWEITRESWSAARGARR